MSLKDERLEKNILNVPWDRFHGCCFSKKIMQQQQSESWNRMEEKSKQKMKNESSVHSL